MQFFGFDLDFRSELDKQDQQVIRQIEENAKQAKKQKMIKKLNEEIRILNLKKDILESVINSRANKDLKEITKKLNKLKERKERLL